MFCAIQITGILWKLLINFIHNMWSHWCLKVQQKYMKYFNSGLSFICKNPHVKPDSQFTPMYFYHEYHIELLMDHVIDLGLANQNWHKHWPTRNMIRFKPKPHLPKPIKELMPREWSRKIRLETSHTSLKTDVFLQLYRIAWCKISMGWEASNKKIPKVSTEDFTKLMYHFVGLRSNKILR